MTLKLLERATLAKKNVECHPPNNVIKKKERLFVFSMLFHSDLVKVLK